ncbi:MAG: hypothetical protein WC765_01860 [Phycisphaerae bacterium]|jgi:hypothetical protein
MISRAIRILLILFLGGCAAVPPKAITSIGGPDFQNWVKKSFKSPTSSFTNFQFYSALNSDKAAIESLFHQALYNARNPLLGGAEEAADIWTIQSVLISIGEDRFLSILEGQYTEVQKAVLAPMDKRVLRGAFPKVSKLRAKYFSD